MEHRHTHQRWLWSGWSIAFPKKLISLKSGFIWPPRLLDLNSLHFYLWGYERWNQKKNIPATISQLKDQVKEIIVSIPAEILQELKLYRNKLICASFDFSPEKRPPFRRYAFRVLERHTHETPSYEAYNKKKLTFLKQLKSKDFTEKKKTLNIH